MKRLSEASVVVVGAGIMGAGIAQVAAQAGHSVKLFDVRVGYPAAEDEVAILRATTGASQGPLAAVLDADQTLALQRLARAVAASDPVLRYAASLVRATRPDDPGALGHPVVGVVGHELQAGQIGARLGERVGADLDQRGEVHRVRAAP